MNTRHFDPRSGERGDGQDTASASGTPIAGDTSIIEGTPEPPVRGPGGQLMHIEVGAQVFSSDGEAVAVVEITGADTIGIRAGSPGRSIVVPASGIARVAPDGRRVDLYASAQVVRDLSGANQPGVKHLEAQQPDTLARDDSPGPPQSGPPPGTPGVVGPTGEATQTHGAP